jgi:hypothetical protein
MNKFHMGNKDCGAQMKKNVCTTWVRERKKEVREGGGG